MFHDQHFQGLENSESAALNPQALTLPHEFPVSHTARYTYPVNTAQQSGFRHSTYASIDETTPASQNARESSQVHYATPGTAPTDTPRYWGFQTNDMVFRPQGLFDSDIHQLSAELSNSSQRSLGLPTNDFVRQAPLPGGSAALALPPSSEGNGPRPGHTKLDDKPCVSDVPLSRNTPVLHQPRGYRIEKTRRPARQSKRSVALSNLESSKASRTAPPPVPGQQNPDYLTICSFYIWMERKPGVMPTEHEMLCFSLLFGDSFETVRYWFLRNLATHQNDDDTGYQTMTNSSIDVASACHRRRSHCNRKADKLRDEDPGYILIERDETRPFACTSGCGKKFGKKAEWKRHEEMNHPPKGWRCRFMGCQNERKSVYFRRDKFGRHLRKAHPTLNLTKTVMDSCCVPIKSNFSKYCLFHHCDKQFKNWKERIDHIGDHLKNDRWDVSQWRQANDEIEESEDAGDSDSEESLDSDSTGDDDDSDESDADTGLGHTNSGREAGSGPHGRGSKSSRGQRDQGSKRRFNGGATNDLSGYKCSFSHTSSDLITSDSVSTCCNQPVFPISNTDASSSGTLSASYARITITDDKSTGPRSLVEAVLGPLGCGSKASVHEVKMQGYNGTVARKVIRHTSLRKQRGIDREVRIMARFNHPHITRLIEGYEDASSMTLFMLPVAECNLLQYLSGCSLGLSMGGDIEGWFNCLSSGLHHIHEKGVRHRDIKPSNILVKNNGLLYSDFGSSNLVAEEESIGSESADFTEQYAAPEVYRGERGRAADVWSLACVFLEIVTCLLRQPVGDLKAKKRQRLNPTTYPAQDSRNWQWAREWNHALDLEAARSSASPHISVVLDSCEAMMRLRPEQRLTAAEISEKFATCRCCGNKTKTRSKMDQRWESLPGSHEANIARDGNYFPHMVPALVNSSEASTLSDISSSDTTSLRDNNMPKFPTDPWSGHVKRAITIAPADTYSILLDPKASSESMIQRYLLEDDQFEKFLVSGESRYVSRSDMKKKDIGKAVALSHGKHVEEVTLSHEGGADNTENDHGHIDHETVTNTLNSGASKLLIPDSSGALIANQLPVFRDHQRHPPVLQCPFNFLHCT